MNSAPNSAPDWLLWTFLIALGIVVAATIYLAQPRWETVCGVDITQADFIRCHQELHFYPINLKH